MMAAQVETGGGSVCLREAPPPPPTLQLHHNQTTGMPAAAREAPRLCGANQQEANAADEEAEAGPWTQEQNK